MVDGFNMTPRKWAVSARFTEPPLRAMLTIRWPAGVCCQLLATMIHTAENIDPSATMEVASR